LAPKIHPDLLSLSSLLPFGGFWDFLSLPGFLFAHFQQLCSILGSHVYVVGLKALAPREPNQTEHNAFSSYKRVPKVRMGFIFYSFLSFFLFVTGVHGFHLS